MISEYLHRRSGALVVLVTASTLGLIAPYALAQSGDDAALQAVRQVDLSTYIGWRVFERHCSQCHARGGVGSRFAPALAPRIKNMTRQDFFSTLRNGYQGLATEMPPWGENRDVGQYADALWSYLQARATGGLPPGALEPVEPVEPVEP